MNNLIILILILSVIFCTSNHLTIDLYDNTIGPGGVNCVEADTDDPPPSVCKNGGSLITTGQAECGGNYDCCYCKEIICNDCKEFDANGDQSAIGIGNGPLSVAASFIQINGVFDGALVKCSGDVSCSQSRLIGTNIAEALCSGDESCKNSVLDFKCVKGKKCLLECDGESACLDSEISIDSVEKVICGQNGCENAKINIKNPYDAFEIECGGYKGCSNAVIRIDIQDSNFNSIKGIKCGAYKSCEGLTVYINSDVAVKIDAVECGGRRTCRDLRIIKSANVEIGACNGCPGNVYVEPPTSSIPEPIPTAKPITYTPAPTIAKIVTPEPTESKAITPLPTSGDGPVIIINEFFGPGGINCRPAGIDDPPPDVCVFGESITNLGKVECGLNYGCCYCSQIVCNNCVEFGANGDQSAIGIGNGPTSDQSSFIQINGASGGANINCNGDHSCNQTRIMGTNINNVGCSGDNSCAMSIIDVECVADEGCDANCGGDQACFSAVFIVSNVRKLFCGPGGCQNAMITLKNPFNGLEVECGDADGCNNAMITVEIDDPEITELKIFKCNALRACKDMTVVIISAHDIFLEKIECGGYLGCDNAEFILSDTVNLGDCRRCPDGLITRTPINPAPITPAPVMPVTPAPITPAPVTPAPVIALTPAPVTPAPVMPVTPAPVINPAGQQSTVYECVGDSKCRGQRIEIVNPADGFQIICRQKYSCRDTKFIVIIDKPISRLGGILCEGYKACENMEFSVINNVGNEIFIDEIFCRGRRACRGAQFNSGGAIVSSFVCDSYRSCSCFINGEECRNW